MKIVLEILYIAVGFFLLVFLESIFVNLFSFRLIFLLFLFAYKKIDWKKLLVVASVLSLVMDVTMHYKLGTNLLMLIVPLGMFSLFSTFSSVEDGIGSYIVRFVSILLYHILNLILPSLLLTGTLGVINGKLLIYALINSLVSILFFLLVNYIIGGIRKKGDTSKIRLK